jgi:hypothetical protein
LVGSPDYLSKTDEYGKISIIPIDDRPGNFKINEI